MKIGLVNWSFGIIPQGGRSSPNIVLFGTNVKTLLFVSGTSHIIDFDVEQMLAFSSAGTEYYLGYPDTEFEAMYELDGGHISVLQKVIEENLY